VAAKNAGAEPIDVRLVVIRISQAGGGRRNNTTFWGVRSVVHLSSSFRGIMHHTVFAHVSMCMWMFTITNNHTIHVWI